MGTNCSCFKYTVKGSGSQTPKIFADQVYDLEQKKYQDTINADLLSRTESLEETIGSFKEITEEQINALF